MFPNDWDMVDNIRFQTNCDNISWDEVPALLGSVGMSHTDTETHRQSFEASYAVVFVFDANRLIGFGRIISDGVRQAAVYDVAIDPAYQGRRIGSHIMSLLQEAAPGCNFILYASPGKEPFYEKLGFKKMKTGMILFADEDRMNDETFVEL